MSHSNNPDHLRPQGFVTSLPRLPTLLSYVDKSYTSVKLAPSLAERVSFSPWTAFDDMVVDVKRQIDSFPSFIGKESFRIQERLRQTLDPASAPMDAEREKIEAFFRQRERYLSGTASNNGETETIEVDRSVEGYAERGIEIASDVNSSLKGKLVFTSSSSCEDVNCKVFDVVQDLTRALTACRGLHIVSQLQVNSEFGRAYDMLSPTLSSGPSDQCTLTPDKALTLTTERPASSLPICAFELKGPLQFFWKGKSPVLRKAASKKRRCLVNEESTLVDGNTDEIMYSDALRVGRLVRSEFEYNYSAEGMSEFFNDVFDHHKRSSRKIKDAGSHLFLRIAQAVSQALLTDSGCGVLYNHDEAVAFQVIDSSSNSTKNTANDGEVASDTTPIADTAESPVTGVQEQMSNDVASIHGQTRNNNGSLSVLVSRLYACDDEPSNICALLAVSTHSYNIAVGYPERKLQVRAAFQEATRTLVNQKTKKFGGCKAGNSRSAASNSSFDNTSGAEGSRSQRPLGPVEQTLRTVRQSDASREMAVRPENRNQFDLTRNHAGDEDMVSSGSTRSSDSIASVFVEDNDVITQDEDPRFWKALSRIISNNFGVIGHGATSVIIGSRFDGRKVAVKSWNGVEKVGLYCLLNEIRIYRALHDERSDALGVVIPKLIMSTVAPKADVTLVVDLVGAPVRRHHEGCLITEEDGREKRLGVRDIQFICEAALESLRALHRSRVLHGDIDLKNLRIDRKVSEVVQTGWKAWWIDLGLAKLCDANPIELEIELSQCVSLFPEASVDSSITTA